MDTLGRIFYPLCLAVLQGTFEKGSTLTEKELAHLKQNLVLYSKPQMTVEAKTFLIELPSLASVSIALKFQMQTFFLSIAGNVPHE